MIFNPFDIQSLHDAILQVIPQLPWAPPQLQDNIPLVLLVILFAVADLLAFHPKGVVMHELAWLANTRNARTFEASAVVYPWLKPILFCQFFIFFALCLLDIIDPLMAEHFSAPDTQTLWLALGCLAVPLGWFLLQRFLFNWFCYLAGIRDRQIIMNRCYLAMHIVLAPLSTVIFMCVLAGSYPPQTILFLLAVLFILSQIVFIFNGFKIFCVNFYSFCLIIVYLCTLEIAPLLVIYAKFVR